MRTTPLDGLHMRPRCRIQALGTRSAAEAALIYANVARTHVRGVDRWSHERMPPSPLSELFRAPRHRSASPPPRPDTLRTGSAPAGDALPPPWTTLRYLLASIIASPAPEALAPAPAPRLHDSNDDAQKVNYNMILECIPDSEYPA